MKFNLAKYMLPSVVSMVLIGTYTNIDGLFIGKAMGDVGLAAINFAWPIIAFSTSVGTGIGVGGAVMINTLRGQNLSEDVEKAKRTSLLLLIIAGLVTTLFSLAIYSPVLKLIGAKGRVLEFAQNYCLVVSLGALFQVLGGGLIVLLRNEGSTVKSMLYTFVGLVVHVVLDLLLVEKWKLYGVAFSTVCSQAVIAALCLTSFRVKRFKPSLDFGKDVLKSSVAPFGLNFVPSVVLLVTNFFATRAGGEEAVSAYAVMSYAVYTFDYVFQGVCDGVQPVLSYCEGAKDSAQKRTTVKTSVIALAALSVVFMALTPVLIKLLPPLFNVSEVTAGYISAGFMFYAFSYPLKAAVKFVCAYNYSVKNNLVSNVATYVDPLLFSPLFLLIMPLALGIDGIWIALPAAQAATLIVAVAVVAISSHKKKQFAN